MLVPRAGVEPARPFGQRILSPVIGPLPNLTKRYKPSIYAPSGRRRLVSAGLVSTRPATILAPSKLGLEFTLNSRISNSSVEETLRLW